MTTSAYSRSSLSEITSKTCREPIWAYRPYSQICERANPYHSKSWPCRAPFDKEVHRLERVFFQCHVGLWQSLHGVCWKNASTVLMIAEAFAIPRLQTPIGTRTSRISQGRGFLSLWNGTLLLGAWLSSKSAAPNYAPPLMTAGLESGHCVWQIDLSLPAENACEGWEDRCLAPVMFRNYELVRREDDPTCRNVAQ